MLRRWIKYAETIKRRTKHDSSDGLYTHMQNFLLYKTITKEIAYINLKLF